MAHTNTTIVAALMDVWRTSEERTLDIIRHLDQNVPTADYFINCLRDLKPLSKSESGAIRIAHANNNIVENVIEDAPIGKGAFGEVSLSIKGRIYKQIIIRGSSSLEVEFSVREIFLETFIQTVLSHDANFSHHIPRIFNLYRSDRTPELEGVLYIVMEHVPFTLKSVLKDILKSKQGSRIDIHDIAPIMIQIGSLLYDLHYTYKFYHGDLHGGNIMLDADRATVQLIDFGKSCLTIGDITYSLVYDNIGDELRIKNASCKSWDLLILLTYLLQYSAHMLNEKIKIAFHIIMTSASGTDIYEEAKMFAERKRIPLFHAMYSDRIAEWPTIARRELSYNTPLLDPANFTIYMIDLHKRIIKKNITAPSSRKLFEPDTVRVGGKIAGLHRMVNRKCNRKNTRKNGGGYQTSQQMFDPDVLPPSTLFAAPSTAPTTTEIRPVLYSTFQAGGKTRRNRKNTRRGGFSPSVMGGFVANAQAAIVPLALYAVYHTMVPKTGTTKLGGLFNSKKTRKTARSRK